MSIRARSSRPQAGPLVQALRTRRGRDRVADETSPSIYVRFEMTSKPAGLENFDGPVDFIIWTTTPWTIPPTRPFPSARRRLCRR